LSEKISFYHLRYQWLPVNFNRPGEYRCPGYFDEYLYNPIVFAKVAGGNVERYNPLILNIISEAALKKEDILPGIHHHGVVRIKCL
jgi:hypothetical protein